MWLCAVPHTSHYSSVSLNSVKLKIQVLSCTEERATLPLSDNHMRVVAVLLDSADAEYPPSLQKALLDKANLIASETGCQTIPLFQPYIHCHFQGYPVSPIPEPTGASEVQTWLTYWSLLKNGNPTKTVISILFIVETQVLRRMAAHSSIVNIP